ncbi:hypothetical protein Dda_1582 [Drechslerella dactyloides]|uniref:Nucleoside phosphorylase domain-containing protein n=1 Tax=Drechslerella dactyloides TaxID=74499 RepID=A0AAD6J1Z0_DREDA|nr:hypothetical protein Dda_1582 [Drechslerella dactyloides]
MLEGREIEQWVDDNYSKVEVSKEEIRHLRTFTIVFAPDGGGYSGRLMAGKVHEATKPQTRTWTYRDTQNRAEPIDTAMSAQRTHDDYTVAWICALPKELAAALAMLDRKHANLSKPPNDYNEYSLGSVGEHNIVITCLPKGKIGNASAAAVVARLINTFQSVRFGFMIGIGGGVPQRVRLGDVVVSTPVGPYPGVVQWDMGKATAGDDGFELTGALDNPPHSVLAALAKLESGHNLEGSKIPEYLEQLKTKWPEMALKYSKSELLEDLLFRSDYNHIVEAPTDIYAVEEDAGGDCQSCDKAKLVRTRKARNMKIHYGLIASGNQVIKDAALRDRINRRLGGHVLCLEMEAAGILNIIPCIVIRGICDYADSHKNETWQEYAAALAAAFAKELLEYLQPSDRERPARDPVLGHEGDLVENGSLHDLSQQLKPLKFIRLAKFIRNAQKIDSLTTISRTLKFSNPKRRYQSSRYIERLVDALRPDGKSSPKPVLSWLGCEYNAEQRGYFNRSIPGTGEWFLKSQEYMDWRYRTEGMTAVLFCFGSPGVGKSTLASMVIRSLQDEYREERNVGVAYVYFDYTRQREQTPEHLVGSLLRQLVQKLWETNRLLPDSVKSFFEKYTQSGRYPSLAEFSQVLLSVIDVYSDVFVVVDALDECLEDHLADFIPSEIERRSDALYVFAARNWGFYARHSSDGEELVLEFLRNRMTVTACVQAILAQLNFEGTYREDAADSVSGLHLATYFGLHKSINILIEEGAELDQRDCHGSTPLSWAAKFGDEAAVKLLISSGATLDTQNQDGLTPLCLAAASGYKTVVMLLLDANADPLGGSKDKKPLLLAEENKHDEVAALISEYAHEVARREMDASDTLPDISEVSSICSEGSMTSDQSSADRRDELSKKACYIVGEIFCTDPRLRELYQEALKKFSKKKFAKLHDNILKEFFKALNVEVRRALPKAPGLQVIKVLQRSVERGLVTDSIYDICNPSENTMWNSGVSMLNAHALNDHDESNVKSMILQDPVSFKSFVTRRESFGQFKASIHALVRPTTAIPAALQFNHGNLLQRLLSKHLDQVAVGEYFWITELAEAGYSAAEIAEILIQGTTDTPWIYFEPRSQDSPKVFPRDDFHAPGCVHHCFDCLTDVEHAHRDQDSPGVDMNLDEIQELCGLAGITPSSRDPDSWNGVVTFRDENTVAMVSYGFESLKRNRNHEILRRNTTILSRLCSAAGRMQSSSLCCDAFTVLTRPIQVLDAEAAPVNLCRVEFRLMMRLLDTLKGLSVSDLATRSRSADLQKSILEIFDGIEPNIFNNEKMESSIDETLNALSLTVQFLSIGFLSYNQGHVGPIQPFFLDTPQRKIILTGSKQPGNRCITIGLTNLTCLGNMIGGAVLVFRLQQSSVGGLDLCFENEGTFDVFATAQDVLDTWGPGSFVVQTNEGLRPAPCAIKLRGGLIYPLVGENNNLFHWSDMVDIDSLRLSPFDPRSKIRIGSPVEVNLTCALDENECWQKSLCAFSSLDVHRHYWKHVETQIGGQAGNYILLQTNWTKHKIPGKTFKQEILEQEPKMLVRYLNCLCGLQVSFCTGVARRVTLRELIRDVFPIFADILITENAIRDELENQYNILEAFRTDTVQESLKRLPKQLYELMLSIIWSIVSCLRSTGIDPEGKFLSVAWLYAQDDGPIQCLRIPCSDKKNSWVHVLADAEDCATFAYISTDCLVTPEVQCRGPSPLWHNTTPLLETAVLQHNENPSQPLSQLENSRVYFFKKMDTLLKVNVNRRTPTSIVTLFVGQSSIPAKFTRRLYVMERHRWIRIRERQRSSEDGVEQVTVLAKDDKGLPSLLRSRSSTSTIQSPNNSGVPPVDPVSKDSS